MRYADTKLEQDGAIDYNNYRHREYLYGNKELDHLESGNGKWRRHHRQSA